jgi:hypothetical protein
MRFNPLSSGGAKRFLVSGRVEELETRRPLFELVVRAFDRDLFADDLLGWACTGPDGRFAICFDRARFRELTETRPDLYLRVYDRLGSRVLYDGVGVVRQRARLREDFLIRIAARELRPQAGAVSWRRAPGGSA